MMTKVAMLSMFVGAVAGGRRNLRFGYHMEDAPAITSDEVYDALTTWSAGIVEIGAVFQAGGNYTQAAADHIDTLYAYDIMEGDNVVLFKPTLASEVQFRPTFLGALSYFVTGIYPEDGGFAIAPYTAVRYDISGIFIDSDSASSMGNYWFTGLDGNETKVEFTFQYVRNPSGDGLKIVVHHSSLPYSP